MLTPDRLYIASPDAARLERIFAYEPAFCVLGASGDGQTALREIRSLRPDVLLLDEVLSGLDGYAALERLEDMPTPPRTALLCRSGMGENRCRADILCAYPCKEEEALSAAKRAADTPVPALAAPWAEARRAAAEKLLDFLGVDRRLRGWQCMREAAAALSCAPSLGYSYRERLYPYAAAQCHTTPQAAERAVRTAVESTWLHGNLEAIQQLFGFSVDADRGKPTNAEFLSMLAEHVRRETAAARMRAGM